MDDQIFKLVDVEIKYRDGKPPYLKLRFPGQPSLVVCVSANLGEMIGGAAKGARERYELLDRQKRR